MTIVLRAECYRLLLEHIPETTPAYAALASATELQGGDRAGHISIQCTEVDADLYLASAEQFFADCLSELKSAIAAAAPSFR